VPVVRVSDVVFIEIFPFLAFLEHLGEQLLRIGADAHAARSRKLNVQVPSELRDAPLSRPPLVWVLAVYNTFLICVMLGSFFDG
jgi:hypothetical protein